MCDEMRWPFLQSICVSCFGKYLKGFVACAAVFLQLGCAVKKPVEVVLPSHFKADRCTVSHRSIQGIPTRVDCVIPALKNCQVTAWHDNGEAFRCYCGKPQETIDAKTRLPTILCFD